MSTEKPRIDRPHMCPECRAGKRHITSENTTAEHELRLRLTFTCDRCGWSTERRPYK